MFGMLIDTCAHTHAQKKNLKQHYFSFHLPFLNHLSFLGYSQVIQSQYSERNLPVISWRPQIISCQVRAIANQDCTKITATQQSKSIPALIYHAHKLYKCSHTVATDITGLGAAFSWKLMFCICHGEDNLAGLIASASSIVYRCIPLQLTFQFQELK